MALQHWVTRFGVMVEVLDLQLKSRGFDSHPFHFQATALG